MRKILIVGAGQSGLQLALGLQSNGYEVTLMSNRTADEIRTGRVMSTQCMFHTALQHERDLQLNFWESQAPRIEGVGVSVAGRDASRSPFDTPQRALAVAYVHGLGPRPEHPEFDAVRCNLVPGVGEPFIMPTLTTSGRADILFWEGVPGGPLDAFQGIKDPAEHLAKTLELMEKFTPWEYARAT